MTIERCRRKNCKVVPTHGHCQSCGYPIHPSEKICGECSCEEDGL